MTKLSHLLCAIVIVLICSLAFAQGKNDSTYIYIKINGYILSCSTHPDVSVFENGKWRKIINNLPYKGIYYLDDKYIGYGWCDVDGSVKVDSFSIPLVEYKQIGKKKTPPDPELHPEGVLIKEFQTVSLHGEIKIELRYYSDSTCTKEIIYSQIIKR